MYFPECRETYERYNSLVNDAYFVLEKIFNETQGIKNQKDFAISIIGKTPFIGLLFELRKENGPVSSLKQFQIAWRNNANGILKYVLNK